MIFQQHPEKYTNLAELEQKLIIEFQKLNEAYVILLERAKNSKEINNRTSFAVASSNRNKITLIVWFVLSDPGAAVHSVISSH